LAMEVWAVVGSSVQVERHSPHVLSVSYEGFRWTHCAGIAPVSSAQKAYDQTLDALTQMHALLIQTGSGFEQVVRTWFYLGGINDLEADRQRYEGLNRARTDFYSDINFHNSLSRSNCWPKAYPSSTGIGMAGKGFVASCLTFDTRRKDVFLMPLESPVQTPAYAYEPLFLIEGPKFSRAMAWVFGNDIVTWISGTASIVDSESCHLGDVEKQTGQTLDNIAKLISRENFTVHGVKDAGNSLQDLAAVRVYIKRPEDFQKCKTICERRLAGIPSIYVIADVCRSELLVEVEGVAFSRCSTVDGRLLEEIRG